MQKTLQLVRRLNSPCIMLVLTCCIQCVLTCIHTCLYITEQLTLVTEVILTASKLTITEMARTGQVATVTLLVLCIPPPETIPTPP